MGGEDQLTPPVDFRMLRQFRHFKLTKYLVVEKWIGKNSKNYRMFETGNKTER